MSCLHVCPSCARHVRSDETSCPFCERLLPEDFAVCGPARATDRPLTRAALVLMSATALTACGKTSTSSPGSGVDIYGPAPVDVRADSGATEAQMPVAVYGPPPMDPPDAVADPQMEPKK